MTITDCRTSKRRPSPASRVSGQIGRLWVGRNAGEFLPHPCAADHQELWPFFGRCFVDNVGWRVPRTGLTFSQV